MIVENRLKELNITLPPSIKAAAVYVPAVLAGDLLFIAGQMPRDSENKLLYKGKVGTDLTVEEAQKAAEVCVLRAVSVMKDFLGDLDKVERIVKLNGCVNCPPDFELHSKVIDGASMLLEKIFGEKGKHARAAIGVGSLAGNGPVEIEIIAQIRKDAL